MGEPALTHDKRQFTRRVLKTSVNMASESNFYTGFTNDISEGGLFVATYDLMPIGTVVQVEFDLPDAATAITVAAEVRWIREHNPSSDAGPGMGLCFVDLGEDTRTRIEAFVAQRDTLFFVD